MEISNKRPLEMCFVCDGETGHAGRSDDSLYGILNYPLWEMFELSTSDEIGPLCMECHHALSQIGFIDD